MISDDDLLLYHYREGLEPADRARIGAALAENPEVAQRLHRLVTRLDAVAAIPEVPVPEATMNRWRAAIDAAAAGQTTATATPQRRPQTTHRWLAAAAVAVLAIAAAFQFTREKPQEQVAETPAAPTDAATPADPGAAYERGLKFHLASTEQTLATLDSASPDERARLIETISAQNRMYALAADRAGEPQLARVLRAFAPILDSLAQGDGDSSSELAQLSFELRVMQGRLGTDAHAAAGSGPTTL